MMSKPRLGSIHSPAVLEDECKRLRRYSRSYVVGYFVMVLMLVVSLGNQWLGGFHVPLEVIGQYYPNGQVVNIPPGGFIMLTEKTDSLSAIAASIHEVGHKVFADLNDSQRREWRILSNRNSSGFVSDYASSNPSEDFAESFRDSFVIVHDSSNLRVVDEKKAEFMNVVWKDLRQNTRWQFGGVLLSSEMKYLNNSPSWWKNTEGAES